jgi:Uma2 family endonuclease
MAIEVEVTRRRFTVDEYDRMVEVGILTETDRVELIHGEIVRMTPSGRRHSTCVSALLTLFVTRLGSRVVVWSHGSVPLPPYSQPEPDVLLLRPRPDLYRDADPLAAADALLVVEVAETSLRYDREVKVPLYGASGIRETWVVDLEGECVEIYREPTPGGYRQHQRIPRGPSFSPEAFPDLALTVADILG